MGSVLYHQRLYSSAIFNISSISQGWPVKCTGIIALVFSVILALISFGSMLYVSGSISAKTGFAPIYSKQLAEAAKVMGVVITSSPLLFRRQNMPHEVPQYRWTRQQHTLHRYTVPDFLQIPLLWARGQIISS